MDKVQALVIGGGPAGLSAAIYTGRADIDTLVLGCDPKVAGDYDIDNYFGFPETITGKELIERGRTQALRFGATIACEKVLSVHPGMLGGFHVKTKSREVECQALILATGMTRVRPSIGNLSEYEGKGVSYCVSCDGFFYKGRKVLVVGEGDFAANQALELLSYTPLVSLCTQGKEPAFSPEFAEKLEHAGIPVIRDAIAALHGSPALAEVEFKEGRNRMEAFDGLFVAMGEASSADFASTLGIIREGNAIVVDDRMRTNVPGVFAAGDCTGGFLQIAVAVGQGAVAAKSAIDMIKKRGKKA